MYGSICLFENLAKISQAGGASATSQFSIITSIVSSWLYEQYHVITLLFAWQKLRILLTLPILKTAI